MPHSKDEWPMKYSTRNNPVFRKACNQNSPDKIKGKTMKITADVLYVGKSMHRT